MFYYFSWRRAFCGKVSPSITIYVLILDLFKHYFLQNYCFNSNNYSVYYIYENCEFKYTYEIVNFNKISIISDKWVCILDKWVCIHTHSNKFVLFHLCQISWYPLLFIFKCIFCQTEMNKYQKSTCYLWEIHVRNNLPDSS